MATYRTLTAVIEASDIERSWWGRFPDPLDLVEDILSEEEGAFVEQASLILSIIKSMVPAGQKFQVRLDADSSYCAYGPTATIGLGMNVYGLKTSLRNRNKIMLGRLIHEIGHLKYTYPAILKETGLTTSSSAEELSDAMGIKSQRLASLINIFEDRRIEEKICKDYPGYFKYLHISRNAVVADSYVAETSAARENESKSISYNPATELSGAIFAETLMQYITQRVLYPTVELKTPHMEKVEKDAAEYENFEEIDKLLDSRPQAYSGVIGLAKKINSLLPEDHSSTSHSTNLTGHETSLKKTHSSTDSSEEASAAKQLEEEVQSKLGNYDKTSFNESDIEALTVKEEAEKAGNNNKEIGGKILAVNMHDERCDKAYSTPEFFTFSSSKRSYNQQASEEIERRLRRDFKAYSTVMERERIAYEQEEGELDEDELYSVRFNQNIFQDEVTENTGGSLLEVILLVDASGSMFGRNIELARTISVGLAKAFSNNPTILFSAYAHTANTTKIRGLAMVELKKKDKKLDLINFESIEACCNNADGYAIGWCANQFEPKSLSKLLIVLSDGQPSAVGYGGDNAYAHVMNTVIAAQANGVKVVSLAVAAYNQKDCYPQDCIISYATPTQVTKDLCDWIHKNFSQKMALQFL